LKPLIRWFLVGAALLLALGAVVAGRGPSPSKLRTSASTLRPPRGFAARRLRQRANALPAGSLVSNDAIFGQRVFANATNGFALADGGEAQYPAASSDGGHTWRIDGPQLHVDAADAPEAVNAVGIAGPRTYFAYGSSVVDVTTDAGRTWWETFLGELVMAVVPGQRHDLIAYVQQSSSRSSANPAVTWQYVSRDGGRHWRYSSALGG
jgi:hypothetical protein